MNVECKLVTGLGILFIVIPVLKAGSTSGRSSWAFFWYDADAGIVFLCMHRLYFHVRVTQKEGLAHQALLWHDNDNYPRFSVMWLMYESGKHGAIY